MKLRIIFYLFIAAVISTGTKADYGSFKIHYNSLKQNAFTFPDGKEMVRMAIEADIETYQEARGLLENGQTPEPRHDCKKRSGEYLTTAKVDKRIAFLQDVLVALA